jgi:hypothetical protein
MHEKFSKNNKNHGKRFYITRKSFGENAERMRRAKSQKTQGESDDS